MKERWEPIRKQINFKTFIYIGGGLGDVVHHYKNNAYFRILASLRDYFPLLRVYLYLDGKNPGLTRQIFEKDPGIDEIVTAHQRGGDFNWTHIDRFMRDTCRIDPGAMAAYTSGMDPEWVVRRVVNRIYPLIRFPRIRAICMDDFFQQMDLTVDEFDFELAEVACGPDDLKAAKALIHKARSDGLCIIGIHPFTHDPGRACYPVNRWKLIIRDLLNRNYAVAVFGAPDEREPFKEILTGDRVIDLTHEIGIRTKTAILKQCAGCITIDGAIMHLSWLHAIPTVSIVERTPDWSPSFTTNVHGYHWASIAEEPFARRVIVEQGKAGDIDPGEVVKTVMMLAPFKGMRTSKVWRDQL